MLDQTPPAGSPTAPAAPPKIKKKGNIVVSTASDGAVTYYPKKFYKEGLGFPTEDEALKAQKMSLDEAVALASGTKNYLAGDAAPPTSPDPTQSPEGSSVEPAVAPTVKPEWVIRREKLGIPYSWDAKLKAWVPAGGQRISV